jgi:hypothetical protein
VGRRADRLRRARSSGSRTRGGAVAFRRPRRTASERPCAGERDRARCGRGRPTGGRPGARRGRCATSLDLGDSVHASELVSTARRRGQARDERSHSRDERGRCRGAGVTAGRDARHARAPRAAATRRRAGLVAHHQPTRGAFPRTVPGTGLARYLAGGARRRRRRAKPHARQACGGSSFNAAEAPAAVAPAETRRRRARRRRRGRHAVVAAPRRSADGRLCNRRFPYPPSPASANGLPEAKASRTGGLAPRLTFSHRPTRAPSARRAVPTNPD